MVDATNCPSCGGSITCEFYRQNEVPVHSAVVLTDQEEALEFPRGSISLAHCPSCGFITNLDYETSLLDYSQQYEDQQCFSPTFNTFARDLAKELIRKHDIRKKTILEIGCGKADFLALLCKLGDNKGIGIDPALSETRVEGESTDKMTLIKDYFTEEYLDIDAEVVICRHTLEHIHDTGKFMGMISDTMGGISDRLLFIEVPDTQRILDEMAFWDIYYEHCSYFTPGSLDWLLRNNGFRVLKMTLTYGKQYLLAEAKPTNKLETGGKQSTFVEAVDNFARQCPGKIGSWRDVAGRAFREEHGIIWGSGSKCVAFLTAIEPDEPVENVVDINPYRQGKYLPGVGVRVIPPSRLTELSPGKIIVMNPVYEAEIGGMLGEMGIEAGTIPVE